MKGKKAQIFMVLLVIIAVVTLLGALYILSFKKPYEGAIGEKQNSIIQTYQEAENSFLYLDIAARYSAIEAKSDFTKKSSLFGDCGDYLGYVLFTGKDPNENFIERFPDRKEIQEQYLEHFSKRLDKYLNNYGDVFIPLNNYDLTIKDDEIIGKAKTDLVFLITSKENEEQAALTTSLTSKQIDLYLKSKDSPLSGYGECIKQAEERTGVPAIVILGVAVHESRYGKSDLADGYCPGEKNPIDKKAYNLFGYKGEGTEGSCKWKTMECLTQDQMKDFDIIKCDDKCSNGKESCQVWANFRAYNDPCESIEDFADLISKAQRYERAMQYSNNPNVMASKIRESGYATDPDWATGVINHMQIAQNYISQQETLT